MKNNLAFIFIGFLLVLMLILTSCEPCNYRYQTDNPFTLEEQLIQNMTDRYQNGNEEGRQKEPKTPNESNGDQASVKTQGEEQSQMIMSANNTTSVWFDMKTLKEFMYQIETISKKTDASIDEKDLGVRIYFATYPAQNTWNEGTFPDLVPLNNDEHTQQYAFKNTVILIPTLEREGVNRDFDPLRSETYDEGLRVAQIQSKNSGQQVFNGNNKVQAFQVTLNSQSTMALNHGTLIPPPSSSQVGSF